MRVAIVNDVRLAVEALRRMLATIPGCEVAWVASDGEEAVAKCASDRPDLLLMDLVMPVMDGVEATQRIMRASPCPILIVTSTVDGHLERVYNALGAGALDAVQGPVFRSDGTLDGAQPVVKKIRTLQRLPASAVGANGAAAAATPEAASAAPVPASAATDARTEALLVLGASTGGPEALRTVLHGFSRSFTAPIVVVQHLGADFVPGFVTWLASQTGRVIEAVAPGQRPEHGKVLVACSDDHLVLRPDGTLAYVVEPSSLPYRPSVDVFFGSLAANGPSRGVAAVLTGMGRDGAEGLLALRRAGWRTFAQDEATSVVFGMPRAARDVGAAQEVLPLTTLAPALEAAWAQRASPAGGGIPGPRPAATRPSEPTP
jgi:two-component system, chemotaxis family, response regulator WspF